MMALAKAFRIALDEVEDSMGAGVDADAYLALNLELRQISVRDSAEIAAGDPFILRGDPFDGLEGRIALDKQDLVRRARVIDR